MKKWAKTDWPKHRLKTKYYSFIIVVYLLVRVSTVILPLACCLPLSFKANAAHTSPLCCATNAQASMNAASRAPGACPLLFRRIPFSFPSSSYYTSPPTHPPHPKHQAHRVTIRLAWRPLGVVVRPAALGWRGAADMEGAPAPGCGGRGRWPVDGRAALPAAFGCAGGRRLPWRGASALGKIGGRHGVGGLARAFAARIFKVATRTFC